MVLYLFSSLLGAPNADHGGQIDVNVRPLFVNRTPEKLRCLPHFGFPLESKEALDILNRVITTPSALSNSVIDQVERATILDNQSRLV